MAVEYGMSYMHGDHLTTPNGDVMLDIHYVDPLACFYNTIQFFVQSKSW